MFHFSAENGNIFFSGKCNFEKHAKYKAKLWNLDNDVYISRKPFEIEEFNVATHKDINYNEEYVDVLAGNEHFVVLTGTYFV